MHHRIEISNSFAAIYGDLLICRYPEGDIDIARPFPANDDQRSILLHALYDHHQCGHSFENGDVICLPDGTPFAFVDGVEVVLILEEATLKC